MKDLLPNREQLAEEYRVELKEQASELIPFFPNSEELKKGKRVWEAIRFNGLSGEKGVYKILFFIDSFGVFEGVDGVVWFGHNYAVLSDKPCLNNEGKIGIMIKTPRMGNDENDFGDQGPSGRFDVLSDNVDGIIVHAHNFLFTNKKDLEKMTDSWYLTRKLIDRYAYRLGVT